MANPIFKVREHNDNPNLMVVELWEDGGSQHYDDEEFLIDDVVTDNDPLEIPNAIAVLIERNSDEIQISIKEEDNE